MLQNSESKKLRMEAKLQPWGCVCTDVEELSIRVRKDGSPWGKTGLGVEGCHLVTCHSGLVTAWICVHSTFFVLYMWVSFHTEMTSIFPDDSLWASWSGNA